MRDLWLVFAVPMIVALGMTRVMRSLAIRCRAIDRPDGERKLHKQPVPLWGGVAVFAALVGGVVTVRCVSTTLPSQVEKLSTTLLISAGLTFLLGFVDDRFDLRGRLKLLLQFVAVSPIVLAGFWYEEISILNHTFYLGWWGIPFTMFWLVGAVNALNLLDGMDGNASTVGAIACGAVAVIATCHRLDDVALLSVAMSGAILGFLVYNLPSASIYLGDAGSTVIGLVVGFLCLQGARDSTGALRITAPLVVLTVPILDTALAIIRRKLAGRRFDHADRGHIHHRLLDRGFNAWQALAIVGLLCLVCSSAAVAATYFNNEPLAWFTAILMVVVLAQLRYFGHHELALVRRTAVAIYGAVADRWSVWSYRVRWTALGQLPRWTFEESWQTLTAAVSRWPVARVEVCIWRDERPVAIRRWQPEEASGEQGFQWRLTLTLGPRHDMRCELIVIGVDRESHEPRYLSHMAHVLRVYGRYWLRHPERIPAGEDQTPLRIEAAAADTPRRAA